MIGPAVRQTRARRDRDKDVASARGGSGRSSSVGATLRDSRCRHIRIGCVRSPACDALSLNRRLCCHAGGLPTRWLTAADARETDVDDERERKIGVTTRACKIDQSRCPKSTPRTCVCFLKALSSAGKERKPMHPVPGTQDLDPCEPPRSDAERPRRGPYARRRSRHVVRVARGREPCLRARRDHNRCRPGDSDASLRRRCSATYRPVPPGPRRRCRGTMFPLPRLAARGTNAYAREEGRYEAN